MICPRCGNEWDANKSPCTRCGLVIRMPGQSGPLGRAASPPMQKNISQPPNFEQTSTQFAGTRTDSLASRNVPPRPQSATKPGQSADTFMSDLQHSQSAPRANRLVTDPLTVEPQGQHAGRPSFPYTRSSGAATQPLPPGTVLRGGRYRLLELHERQDWLAGAYEAIWIGQDAQRGMSQVMICELVLPENDPVALQTTLRTAAMALTSVGRHPHIPTLWDAFSGRGRNFFVFESMQGESLLNRMRRTGRAMMEQDVIECCLQMTEVLELLAQQSPPLIHGLIRPEHILVGRTGSQYMLTNFSVVLAGGATQFVSGIDRTRLSPYAASEFVRGVIDGRSDLYALMATAYHVVSGSMPTGVSGSIPQAQRLNPNISAQFDAILGRGLRPIASQRYQRPSELRQDLLAMRSVSGKLVPGSAGQDLGQPLSRVADSAEKGQKFEPAPVPPVPDSVAQALQSLAPDDDENQRLLLPRPEELPPMEERNNLLRAAIWLGAIAVCLVLVIVFSRGFYP